SDLSRTGPSPPSSSASWPSAPGRAARRASPAARTRCPSPTPPRSRRRSSRLSRPSPDTPTHAAPVVPATGAAVVRGARGRRAVVEDARGAGTAAPGVPQPREPVQGPGDLADGRRVAAAGHATQRREPARGLVDEPRARLLARREHRDVTGVRRSLARVTGLEPARGTGRGAQEPGVRAATSRGALLRGLDRGELAQRVEAQQVVQR